MARHLIEEWFSANLGSTWEKEEEEIALGLDGEKAFSP
jgi:hypothetical protein